MGFWLKKIFIVNIRIWLLLYKMAVDFWRLSIYQKQKKQKTQKHKNTSL